MDVLLSRELLILENQNLIIKKQQRECCCFLAFKNHEYHDR